MMIVCGWCRQKAGSNVVSVAVTPDGYADAVTDGIFVMPAERQMTFSQFIDIIDHKTPTNGVVYIQKQNSNFTCEFTELSGDVDLQMTWATQTFGNFLNRFLTNYSLMYSVECIQLSIQAWSDVFELISIFLMV